MVAIIKDLLFKTQQVLAAPVISDPLGGAPKNAKAVEDLIGRLQGIVLGAASAIAVAMVIWGAFNIMTAGGNEEKLGKGKKILTYAAMGAILILMAEAFVLIYIRLIGGDVG